jgi:glucose 1-dehydrogenase
VNDAQQPRPMAPARPIFKVLAGQKALVTGANSGIGKAVALGLGQAGAAVAVNYVVDPDSANAVVDAIKAEGGRAIAVKADVSSEDEVEAMFRATIEKFGTLHILVNNAGLQRDAPFHTMRLQQWNTVIGGCKAPRSERARQDAPLTITMP